MNKYRLTVAVLTMLLAAGFATAPVAHADTSYNVNLFGVVIKGYDSVAYFNQGEPVKGNKKFQVAWEGATWRFANAANLETFTSDPEKYAPRYGGYCAYGVATESLYNIDPNAWSIVDGVLYLNKSLSVRELWRKDIPGYIEKANSNWPGLAGN